MVLFWIIDGLILAAALLHISVTSQQRSRRRVCGILLNYLLPCTVGLGGLMGFLGHAFMADEIAESIGWPSGNPFQFEVAVANLAFGILGFLCIWVRDRFWLATGVGFSTFAFGAAYGHIREMVVHQNFAPNNAGPVLVADIFIPALLLTLLLLYFSADRQESTPPAGDGSDRPSADLGQD